MEVAMDDVEAHSTIVGILKQLEPDAQRRVLESVQILLGISSQPTFSSQDGVAVHSSRTTSTQEFSRDRTLSAKEFLRDKRPVTDVERVACLAYYLAHYRDTPH